MLKTVSSVANALGALNYKGTWDASTNTPTLASGVGTQGDYYVVSVAGATDLDGITNWGVGDWSTFNGSVWQRVEGGADGNFENLTANSLVVDGSATVTQGVSLITLGNIGPSGNAGLRISRDDTSISNNPLGYLEFGGRDSTGNVDMPFAHIGAEANGAHSAGNNPTDLFFGTTPSGSEVITNRMRITREGDVSILTGDLIIGTSGKGIDFSATAQAPGSTSELLDDYEEGDWTPIYKTSGTNYDSIVYNFQLGTYIKIGRLVWVAFQLRTTSVTVGSASGNIRLGGLPFTVGAGSADDAFSANAIHTNFASGDHGVSSPVNGTTESQLMDSAHSIASAATIATGANGNWLQGNIIYVASY